MSKVPYNKPALTYTEQIQQLQDRNLVIADLARAKHLLESISYYRLSGYWYPMLVDKKNHLFKENSTFENAFLLYSFDRDLRVLIMRELEKLEVSVRAKMVYVLSHNHGAFWCEDENLFRNHYKHNKSLTNIHVECARSDEDFIVAFRRKYSNPLPPSWMMLEITSFGTLSFLYSNLKPGRTKRDIAHYFGLTDKILPSWLHSIVYLRNLCAHHSRLWNRTMSIQPVRPTRTDKTWLINDDVSNKKAYYILSMLLYFMQTINPDNTLSERFRALAEEYPNVHLPAMGFPKDWEDEPLWQ